MPPPLKTIKAAEAIRCIRSGMDDSALMERFDVTAKGLQSLFDKMVAAGILTRSELEQRAALFYESGSMRVVEAKFPVKNEIKPRVKIFATDVLNCLRSGMDDVALMKRYNLSASGLGASVQEDDCQPGQSAGRNCRTACHHATRVSRSKNPRCKGSPSTPA